MTSPHHTKIPPADADVIIIGAGINGLTCGAVLAAQANLRVVVLEARERPGGLCETRQIIPGYRVPVFAHWLGPLDLALAKALKLHKHGFAIAANRLGAVALDFEGRHLFLDGHARRSGGALASHSEADAKQWPIFDAAMRKAATSVAPWLTESPLQAGGAKSGFLAVAKPKGAIEALPIGVVPLIMPSIASLLEQQFQSPSLCAAIAFEAIVGSGLSPRDPGTAWRWLHRLALEAGRQEGPMHVTGGPGAYIHALASAAKEYGVDIRLRSPVASIIAENGQVLGANLQDGTQIFSPVVISSIDPYTTLTRLGVARALPLGLKRTLRAMHGRPRVGVAKVNLALSGQPVIRGIDPRDLRSRFLIVRSLAALERAYATAEAGELPDELAIEFVMPSAFDPTLAPQSGAVISALVCWVPTAGPDSQKNEIAKRTIGTLGHYLPDLPSRVIAVDVQTPQDLTAITGRADANWAAAGVPDYVAVSDNPYSGPLKGLFFCGEGMHPRAGAVGLTGRNAAEALLATVLRNSIKDR